MRPELRRRFLYEVMVPSLNQRKEDIPLLVRELLKRQVESGDHEARSYLRGSQLQIEGSLLERLVRHDYKTHIGELNKLVRCAVMESEGALLWKCTLLQQTQDAESSSAAREPVSPKLPASRGAEPVTGKSRIVKPSSLPSPELAQQALWDSNGVVTRAAALLGISRDQLNRMILDNGLQVVRVRQGGQASPSRKPTTRSSSTPHGEPE